MVLAKLFGDTESALSEYGAEIGAEIEKSGLRAA